MARSDRLSLAQLIQSYFEKYLRGQCGLSPNTLQSYRDGVLLYLRWLSEEIGSGIEKLEPCDLSSDSVLEFLMYLEVKRKNAVRTRNQRLSALKSFFGHMAYEQPDLLVESSRVSLLKGKRSDKGLIDYLTDTEMTALLRTMEGSDPGTIRDKAMFTLAYAYGLRVSEVQGLTYDRVFLGRDPQIVILGKGGTKHALPLTENCVTVLENWMAVRSPRGAVQKVFLNRAGNALTRGGIAERLSKYVPMAIAHCPTIARKHVTPHVLRHSCAMQILNKTGDPRKVARFLRHADYKSVEIYLHSSAEEKAKLMFEVEGTGIKRGSFAARSAGVLAALKGLGEANALR
ncbi:MAG: tyrosine-type recombinase/integrase [Pseudomonadota bacterium]|nr:tyrosine-type recombinase/integrase [Pseudomonadota bacterium]